MLCLLMEGRHEVGSPVLQSRGSDKLCDNDDESDDVAMDMLHSFLCCFLPLLSPQFPPNSVGLSVQGRLVPHCYFPLHQLQCRLECEAVAS